MARRQSLNPLTRKRRILASPPPDASLLSGAALREAFALPRTLASDFVPEGERPTLANDAACDCSLSDYLDTQAIRGAQAFIGYAACSNLAQDGLMRAGVETLADEMTRKFVELVSTSDDDESEAVTTLTKALERFEVESVFNQAAAKTGYFGGCLVFMDFGNNSPEELQTPLALNSVKIAEGSFKGLKIVEPINISPGQYNASNPLDKNYFEPEYWYILGQRVHSSRFLKFINNEPPLLFKPAYNFFGIPMVQIALDYVADFTGCRNSAARLLRKFSLTIFKTAMDGILYGDDASDINKRLEFFARYRDNDGVMMIDQETEDIVQVNTPLSGVDVIVSQALQLLAAIWRIPAVKLLGISPGGFNATGESDIRGFYDFVASQQKKLFGKPLKTLLTVLQLSELGRISGGIKADFVSLWEMTEREAADIEKIKADKDAVYLDRQVVSQEEVRARIAADPHSGFSGIDVDNVPEAGITDPLAGVPSAENDKAGYIYG